MSLMRLAFWLALLVLLLPTDAAQQARFTSFANAALGRLGTFCDRNTQTCDVGSAAWATFLRKAEFGMRLVGDLIGLGGRQSRPDASPEVSPDRPPPADGKYYQRPGRPGGKSATSYERRPGKRLGTAEAPYEETLAPPEPYEPPWRQSKRPKRY